MISSTTLKNRDQSMQQVWREYLVSHDLVVVFDRRSGQCCLLDFNKTLLKMCRDIASGMEYFSRKYFVHRVSAETIKTLKSSQITFLFLHVGFGCKKHFGEQRADLQGT